MESIKPKRLELTGRIVTLAKDKSEFDIFEYDTKTKVKILNPFNVFCPIQENDAVYLICSADEDTKTLVYAPLVELPRDRDSVINTIFKILRYKKITIKQSGSLYDILKAASDDPCSLLDKWSEDVTLKRDNSTSDSMLEILTKLQYTTLMNGWYKQRILRELYLLGLTNREIRESQKLADFLFETPIDVRELRKALITDPLIFYPLPLVKRLSILERQNREATYEENYCLAIIDFLYKQLEERRWSSVATNVIQKEFADVVTYIDVLKNRFKVKAEFRSLYLPHVYGIEKYTADTICNLVIKPCIPRPIQLSREDLSNDQVIALRGVLNKHFCVILGAAGSGKTTIIKEIIYNHELWGKPYILSSFTGKAVGRIKQVTGISKNAHTIHRFLHSTKARTYLTNNMTVIIDEASMVTTELFYEFLKLVETYRDIRFILVGDTNQLPPISWGCFMENCLASKKVPRFRLDTNHRLLKGDDAIMANSEAILNPPMFDPENDDPNDYREFQFISGRNFSTIEGDLSVVKAFLEKLHSAKIPDDSFTIISPYNKDLDQLNTMAQEIFNGDNKPEEDANCIPWRKGDRVMMTVNNYEIGIMNGDEGRVTSINSEELKVKFNDTEKEYVFSLHHLVRLEENNEEENEEIPEKFLCTKQLIRSYSITVHKAQGSENNIIIIYIPKHQAQNFVNRNLLYTAITRSKKAVFMIGDVATMRNAVYKQPARKIDHLTSRIDNSITDMSDGHAITVTIGEEVLYVSAFKEKNKKITNLCVPFGKKTQVHEYRIDDNEIEMEIKCKVHIPCGFNRGIAFHLRSEKPIFGTLYLHMMTIGYHGGPEIFLVKDNLNMVYKKNRLDDDYVLSGVIIGSVDATFPDFEKIEEAHDALEDIEDDDDVVSALKELGYTLEMTDFKSIVQQFANK